MEHVPVLINVDVFPDTVQTRGLLDVKVTARPELAVAFSITLVPFANVGMPGNKIVCVFDAPAINERVFEVNVTANPDEVVAVKVAEFDTVSGGCAKVMVWVAVLLPHSTNVAP